MPKSAAERVRAYLTRKRARARKAGLCYTCCKKKPNPGLTTCISCNAAALERQRRKRQRNREASISKKLLPAYERAGDVALEHHFHAAAAEHFHDGLNLVGITSNDRERLSEKLIYVLLLTDEREKYSPIVQEYLHIASRHSQNDARMVNILLQFARHLQNDFKQEQALAVIARAIQISETIGDKTLQKLANLRMSYLLHALRRFEESEHFLVAVGEIDENDIASIKSLYYMFMAERASVSGIAKKVYYYFEGALRAASEEADIYRVSVIWSNYSCTATTLGDIELAKSCMERALLAARQDQITSRIPYLCVVYADILRKLGEYALAHSYLLEALSSSAHNPALKTALAETGIPLAIHMQDEQMLAKCAQPSILSLAFQSTLPGYIAPVAAAFAIFFRKQGERQKAKNLLHRAIMAITQYELNMWSFTTNIWDLFLEIARHGTVVDITHARRLLETRTTLPSASVFCACLSLFDALVAQRQRRIRDVHNHAKDSVERFETLHWYGYADIARALLPYSSTLTRQNKPNLFPLYDIRRSLTTRERQVADLVLQGLTNRAIASKLAITENTVETHMASIMNRLGIRSRYQLAEALPIPHSQEIKTEENHPGIRDASFS